MDGGVPVTLIHVPYHLGVEDVGTGKAPQALLDGGAAQVLREMGHDVSVTRIERGAGYLDELSAMADVNVALAHAVRQTVSGGGLPVVLSGDCNAALGVTAALGAQTIAVVWLDAHGDFNTPDTSPSGYLDGMPLAMTTGLCFRRLVWGRLGGDCVPEGHVVHIGSRDLDPGEQRNFAGSGVTVISAAELVRHGTKEALWPALQRLLRGRRVNRRPGESGPLCDVYLHVDIDVLAGEHAPAVGFPAPGGLRPDELNDVIELIGRTLRVRAVTLSGMDPERPDPEGRTVAAGLDALRTAVSAAAADAGGR